MIAVVLRPADVNGLRAGLDRIAALQVRSAFPLIPELRLDGASDPEELLRALPAEGELIVSCRREVDGGSWCGDEERRRRLLHAAAAPGRWIDLEFDVLGETRWPEGVRRLASLHDFRGIPPDLEARGEAARAAGAEVLKFAVMPQRLSELARLGELAKAGHVVVGMGVNGLPTRWLALRAGCPWTYAALDASVSAPGLPSVEEFLSVGARLRAARVFGVLSDRALDSMGPRVWNAAFRDSGEDALYLPVNAPDPEGVRAFAEVWDVAGFSVTTPFKESIREQADEEEDEVAAVGGGNTFWRDGRRWRLANTDIDGVRDPLSEVARRHPGAEALVIGVGGAGAAAVVALRSLGFRVGVVSRNRERGERVARHLGVNWGWPEHAPRLLVNATPAGSPRDPMTMPVPEEFVGTFSTILEMNYHRETPLLRLGRERAAELVSGAAMYCAQARGQLKRFGFDVEKLGPYLERAVAETVA